MLLVPSLPPLNVSSPLDIASPRVAIEEGPDGVFYVRPEVELGPYPRTLTQCLEDWAARTPERTFLAERIAQGGGWRSITYGEFRSQARSVAQALLDLELSSERPIAILSGNDIEHALLGMGALYAGIPYAPVSPAYSLVARI